MKKFTLKLYNYHVWANQTLINHIELLPEELLSRKFNSVFSSIGETFGHIYMVDHIWFQRIKGKSPSKINSKTFDDIVEMKKWFGKQQDEIQSFIKQVDVEKIVKYQNSKGVQFNNPIYEIIQHMVNHGTYHRGNIASLIRQSGFKGVSTDFIFFLRKQD